MLDYRLENRKRQFDNCKLALNKLDDFNLTKSAEKASLTLRKNKLHEFLLEKRLKGSINESSMQFEDNNTSLEIKPQLLSIPSEHIITINNLQESIGLLYQYLTSNNIEYIKAAIWSFRNFFIKEVDEKSIQLISEYKLVYLFVNFLKISHDDDVIENELLWIFINLLASVTNNDIIKPLLDIEVLDVFNRLLKSEFCEIVENTLWVLTGLGSLNVDIRNKLVNHSLYKTTLELLQTENIDASIHSQGIDFLSKCIIKIDYNANRDNAISTLRIFTDNIYSKLTTSNSIKGICAITYLNCTTYEVSNIIIESGVIIKLMKMKYTEDNFLLGPSLEIIANTLYTKDSHIEEIMKMHLLDFYDMVFEKNNNNQYVYYITSGMINLSCSNKEIRMELIDSVIFDKVMLFFDKPHEPIKANLIRILLNLVTIKNYKIAIMLEKKGLVQKIIDKSREVSKEKQIDYFKIVFYYLNSFQSETKGASFAIILEQYIPLVESNSVLSSNDIDSIVKYDY